MSVLLGNECYPVVPGIETEILMPKMTLKTLPNRGKRFFPAHPASPRTIDHYLQTEIFSGEKVSPTFRIQYLPWLCSAFAGIHTSKQF